MTPTPRTAAGRLLLMAGLTFQSGRRLADYPQMLVDIEEQAAAMAARASLLKAIENLLDFLEPHPALEDEQSAHEMMEQTRAALAADPLVTYTDPAGGPDWEPREDEA